MTATRIERGGFVDRGYAVLKGFLGPSLLSAVRRAVEVAVRAEAVEACERPHNRLVPLRWNDRAIDLILESSHRRLAVAAATGGDDLRWISGYVSLKEPRSPAHAQGERLPLDHPALIDQPHQLTLSASAG